MVPPIDSFRALSVDDDEDNREMLVALLAFHGVELKSVSTAKEVLCLSQTQSFDLYLLDAWLSDLDGVELCRQLRKLDPQAFLVFYSGAVYEADRQKAMDAGADVYICKPEIDDLIETISNFKIDTARRTARVFSRQTTALGQRVELPLFRPMTRYDERIVPKSSQSITRHSVGEM